MALPAISFILLLLVTVTAILPGTSAERITLASLLECYPAPSSTANGGAFRADLSSPLGDLPSSAAPMGFASMQSSGAGGDSVFVRALCFGDSQPSQCLACVSTAVKNITDGCAASRRAGIWSDGCFLAYGNTDASSASEDAFRRRIFSGDAVPPTDTFDLQRLVNLAEDLAPRAAKSPALMLATADGNGAGKSTVHALAQCMRDRTAADCARCLLESA